MPRPATGRRRGGQPGNTNRLVHGLYSRRLPPDLMPDLNPRTQMDPEFEIALARIRLVGLLKAQQSASPRQFLSYERAVLAYLHHIRCLIVVGLKRRRREPDLIRLLPGLPVSHGFPPESAADASNLIRTSPSTRGLAVLDACAAHSNFFSRASASIDGVHLDAANGNPATLP